MLRLGPALAVLVHPQDSRRHVPVPGLGVRPGVTRSRWRRTAARPHVRPGQHRSANVRRWAGFVRNGRFSG